MNEILSNFWYRLDDPNITEQEFRVGVREWIKSHKEDLQNNNLDFLLVLDYGVKPLMRSAVIQLLLEVCPDIMYKFMHGLDRIPMTFFINVYFNDTALTFPNVRDVGSFAFLGSNVKSINLPSLSHAGVDCFPVSLEKLVVPPDADISNEQTYTDTLIIRR